MRMNYFVVVTTLLAALAAAPAFAAPKNPCVVMGCGDNVCLPRTHTGYVPCTASQHDVCYQKFGACGELKDGSCGWLAGNPKFNDCMKNPYRYFRQECIASPCGDGTCMSKSAFAGEMETRAKKYGNGNGDKPLSMYCESAPRPEAACYQRFSSCRANEKGACGWEQNPTLADCLRNPDKYFKQECVTTGCGDSACVPRSELLKQRSEFFQAYRAAARARSFEPIRENEKPLTRDFCSSVEVKYEDRCYYRFSQCGQRANNSCGWEATPQLRDCLKHPEKYGKDLDQFGKNPPIRPSYPASPRDHDYKVVTPPEAPIVTRPQ